MIEVEFGIEVKLKKDFLIIKETLERIGICNRLKKRIIPSCYILHKRGRYYIIHFKGLLAMDGFRKDIDQKDIDRQNAIASILENWDMVEIVDRVAYQKELKEKIFVLPFKEKKYYQIIHKYMIATTYKI